MDKSTRNLGNFIREKGTTLAAISEATAIPYQRLWMNLSESDSANKAAPRGLQAGEFLAVCKFLDKNPMDFFHDSDQRNSA